MEAAIAAAIQGSEVIRRTERLLRSMPGAGPVTAATLIALMPELGAASPRRIAALAGLAPFAVESGRFKGVRIVRGGRKAVRNKLYMAAVSAARTKSRLGNFCRRLSGKGKAAKTALIALARKVLTLLSALVRDGVEYARPAT